MKKGQVEANFWRGRRVLLTGHTGFKGAWLALVLERLGSKVIGLSLAPEQPSLFLQAGIARHVVAHHVVDLNDEAAVHEVVTATDPEIVVHFAAQSLVREAFRSPRKTFATNILGAVHLFEALRRCGAVRVILTATTDKVYLNHEGGRPFRESDPLGGLEPYSASKAGVEFVVSAYRRYFADRTSLVVARAGNIIGGGDWSMDRLIPDAIRALMAGVPLDVRNPDAVRPWQFILDVLEGYLLLIEYAARLRPDISDPATGAWNFGPPADSAPITVERICTWINEIWPERFVWRVVPDAEKIRESRLLSLDSSRAMEELEWQPRLKQHEALRAALDWYAAALNGMNPYDLCRRYIDEHLPLAKAPA
jgi:CDP-glucose 4,6-dehydratase